MNSHDELSITKRRKAMAEWWAKRRARENRDRVEVHVEEPVQGCVERRLVVPTVDATRVETLEEVREFWRTCGSNQNFTRWLNEQIEGEL